jgi:carbon monoxide dehydrogenase subunit G
MRNLFAYGRFALKKMRLSFDIKKDPDYIFGYLSDMQKFVSVHPVITKIESRGYNRYLVHETLKASGIPFSFAYPVTVVPYPLESRVVMRATIMYFTKVEMHFTLKPSGDFTLVEEDILFTSPLPLSSLMKGIFKKQHTQLFKNIAGLKLTS